MLLKKEAYNQLQEEFSRRWNREMINLNHYESIQKQKKFVTSLIVLDSYRYQTTRALIGMTLNDIHPLIMTRAKSLSFTDAQVKGIMGTTWFYDDFKLALDYVERYFIYNNGDDDLCNYINYLHTLPKRYERGKKQDSDND